MKKKLGFTVTMMMIVFIGILLNGCGDKIEEVTDYKMTVSTVYGDIEGSYTGELTNDQVTGKGKVVFGDEDYVLCYEGEFADGKFSGEGTLSGNFDGRDTVSIKGTFDGLDKIVGSKSVGDTKVYEGGFTQYKYNNVVSNCLAIGDIVYDGEGALYDRNGEVVFQGMFEKQTPVDKDSFKAACEKYALEKIEKCAESERFNLVSFKCSSPFFIDALCKNNHISIFQMIDNDYLSGRDIWIDYRYPQGSERFADGDVITVYGIMDGYMENISCIQALVVE